MVLPNWGKNWVFFQISVFRFSWLLKNLLCHSYVLTRVSKYHSLEKHLLASAWFLSWGKKKKKLLAAALFMSDGYTVYILKRLECEQLPLLLSHQVSYSLYKLNFYYQRNVSLPLLISTHPGLPRHTPCSAHPSGCLPSTVHQQWLLAAHWAQAEWSLQEGTRKVVSA